MAFTFFTSSEYLMFLKTSTNLLLLEHKQIDFCQMKRYLPFKLEFVSFEFSDQIYIALKDQRFLDVDEVYIGENEQNNVKFNLFWLLLQVFGKSLLKFISHFVCKCW